MGRKCTICFHPQRTDIECDILNNVPFRAISEKYQVGRGPVQRHLENGHIAKEVAEVVRMRNLAFSDDVLHKLKFLQNESLQLLRTAKETESLREARNVINTATHQVEIQAKLAGQIEEINVNVYLSPQWIELKQQIVSVVIKYPEAMRELIEMLEEKNGFKK